MNKKSMTINAVAMGLLVLAILAVILYPTIIKPLIIEPAKGLKDCGFYGGVCENKAWTVRGDKLSCANNFQVVPGIYCDEKKKQPCCKPVPGTEIPETPPEPKPKEKEEIEELIKDEELIEKAANLVDEYERARYSIILSWFTQTFDAGTMDAFKTLIKSREKLNEVGVIGGKYPGEDDCKFYAIAFRVTLEKEERLDKAYTTSFESLLKSKNEFFEKYENDVNFPMCDKIKDLKTMADFNKQENKDLILKDDSLDLDVFDPETDLFSVIPEKKEEEPEQELV